MAAAETAAAPRQDDDGDAAMTQTLWTEIDAYFAERLAPADEALDGALAANARAGLPAIDVAPVQGKLLELLARMCGARRALEIGTLGGYSTIWLARGVGETGQVVTLELDETHAAVARGNLAAAGVGGRVEVRVGRAIDSLADLIREAVAPFDLVFIDADKASTPDYLDASLRLTRPGAVIIVDNVVRDGRVIEADSRDPNVQGIRRFIDMAAADPRLSATAIQTVGLKGHDGFALAVVTG
jgi:predicted O-methyltransferase YrrM